LPAYIAEDKMKSSGKERRMLQESEKKVIVKRMHDDREGSVSIFGSDIEKWEDCGFTFIRVSLQNDMPGVELFRELQPGERITISLEEPGGRIMFSSEVAMVASRSIAYWADAGPISYALEVSEDYKDSFGVSFIVPL
jgi:hypothetical protein